ncbi:MAG TPA: porin [Thermoanaerobaculia bacterium]|nr:porin [Thermoanaerobaculia bacterium]
MKRNAATIAVALALFFAALGAQAQTDDRIQIHGFGGWSYGRSTELSFLGATKKGNADNAQFALNLVAKPYERLNIISQVNLKSTSDNEVDLDYAFAEWMATDQVKLRVGRVKHPLGLYGEVYDVGTVRPFQYLPRSIYGEDGFTAKAYNGAGLTGLTRRGKWELLYDVYAGEIDGDYAIPYIPPGDVDLQASPFVNYGIRYRDVIGGRLQVTTPVEGLLFGVSAYRGKEKFIGRTIVRDVDREVILGSAEYARGPVVVRAEWGRGDSKELHIHEGGYVETSWRVTPKWQVAARYDTLTWDPVGFSSALDPYKLTDHRDVALGLNYWLNSNFVLRANYHITEGNRFAYPATNQDLQAAIAAGTLESDTSALIVGAQFSF